MKKTQQKNNLQEICNNIELEKTPNKTPILLAVTKNQNQETIQWAQNQGLKYFGENKVQEAEKKFSNISKNLELHLIGHLQSNKINKALKIFNVIQTVDTLKLANKINVQAKKIIKKQRIYCQINIGNDPQKSGFSEQQFKKNIQTIINLPNIQMEGIMTILPQKISTQKTKELYLKTKKIRDEINKKYSRKLELSMGMSNDYKIAIECGSTLIRIGTKLFGNRV